MKKRNVLLPVLATAVTMFSMTAAAGTTATAGKSAAALPVLETYVPSNIVTMVKRESGMGGLYSITAIKCTDNTEGYVVRTIKNGKVHSEVINADGTPMTNM